MPESGQPWIGSQTVRLPDLLRESVPVPTGTDSRTDTPSSQASRTNGIPLQFSSHHSPREHFNQYHSDSQSLIFNPAPLTTGTPAAPKARNSRLDCCAIRLSAPRIDDYLISIVRGLTSSRRGRRRLRIPSSSVPEICFSSTSGPTSSLRR